ncbi:MAG: hypothetical protein ACI9NQ_001040 [Paracoccaceae bacterium]|jgi:hypothetical protein
MVGNNAVGLIDVLGLKDLEDLNDGDLCGSGKCCFIDEEGNRTCRKPSKSVCVCITVQIIKQTTTGWFSKVFTSVIVNDGDTVETSNPSPTAQEEIRVEVSWTGKDKECQCQKKISYGQGSKIKLTYKSSKGKDYPWGGERTTLMAGRFTHGKNFGAAFGGGNKNKAPLTQQVPSQNPGEVHVKVEAEGQICYEAKFNKK